MPAIVVDIRRPSGKTTCMSNYVILSRTKNANQFVVMKNWKAKDIRFTSKELQDLQHIKAFMQKLEKRQENTINEYRNIEVNLALLESEI